MIDVIVMEYWSVEVMEGRRFQVSVFRCQNKSKYQNSSFLYEISYSLNFKIFNVERPAPNIERPMWMTLSEA